MPTDFHAAMHSLLDASLAGAATAQQEQALREHLGECAECRQYAEESRRAIATLSGFSFAPDPGLDVRVVAALATRAAQLRPRESCRRILPVSLGALLLTVLGTFCAWHVDAPLAAALHLPQAQAQAGVLALWVMPSWGLALLFPIVLHFSRRSAPRWSASGRSAQQKGSVL